MSDTPHMDRLLDRLFNDPSRELVNFKITPGDAVLRGEATREQLAAEINRALDQAEANPGRCDPPRTRRKPQDVREWLRGVA